MILCNRAGNGKRRERSNFSVLIRSVIPDFIGFQAPVREDVNVLIKTTFLEWLRPIEQKVKPFGQQGN